MICHWAINRTDPQNLLSTTLDVLLHIPINNWFSSKNMAQLLYDKVYPLHGLPLQIILDRGVQYSAELFQEWCKILGIESTMSTVYHPQTDRQTKRVN